MMPDGALNDRLMRYMQSIAQLAESTAHDDEMSNDATLLRHDMSRVHLWDGIYYSHVEGNHSHSFRAELQDISFLTEDEEVTDRRISQAIVIISCLFVAGFLLFAMVCGSRVIGLTSEWSQQFSLEEKPAPDPDDAGGQKAKAVGDAENSNRSSNDSDIGNIVGPSSSQPKRCLSVTFAPDCETSPKTTILTRICENDVTSSTQTTRKLSPRQGQSLDDLKNQLAVQPNNNKATFINNGKLRGKNWNDDLSASQFTLTPSYSSISEGLHTIERVGGGGGGGIPSHASNETILLDHVAML